MRMTSKLPVPLLLSRCSDDPHLPQRLNRQNEMILSAHRTVAETEEVGNEITAELARNREKIQSARSKVRDLPPSRPLDLSL